MQRFSTLRLLIVSFQVCFTLISVAQTPIASKGDLFLVQPRITPLRDKNIIPVFLHQPFRAYDGTGNNVSSRQAFEYGASDIALFPELPAQYDKSDPNNTMAGAGRPSARQISNLLCDEPVTHFNERQLSTFVYVWGQFIDHDMSLTPTGSKEYPPIALPLDAASASTRNETLTRIYLNPASGILNVNLGEMQGPVQVSTYNTTASRLMKAQLSMAGQASMQISVADLPDGVFMVSISNGNEIKTLKLVKNSH